MSGGGRSVSYGVRSHSRRADAARRRRGPRLRPRCHDAARDRARLHREGHEARLGIPALPRRFSARVAEGCDGRTFLRAVRVHQPHARHGPGPDRGERSPSPRRPDRRRWRARGLRGHELLELSRRARPRGPCRMRLRGSVRPARARRAASGDHAEHVGRERGLTRHDVPERGIRPGARARRGTFGLAGRIRQRFVDVPSPAAARR